MWAYTQCYLGSSLAFLNMLWALYDSASSLAFMHRLFQSGSMAGFRGLFAGPFLGVCCVRCMI